MILSAANSTREGDVVHTSDDGESGEGAVRADSAVSAYGAYRASSPYRVRVNLEHFFSDERARCYVCVQSVRPVRELCARLRRRHRLPPVRLLCAGHWLPPDEPLAVLRADDCVRVVPIPEHEMHPVTKVQPAQRLQLTEEPVSITPGLDADDAVDGDELHRLKADALAMLDRCCGGGPEPGNPPSRRPRARRRVRRRPRAAIVTDLPLDPPLTPLPPTHLDSTSTPETNTESPAAPKTLTSTLASAPILSQKQASYSPSTSTLTGKHSLVIRNSHTGTGAWSVGGERGLTSDGESPGTAHGQASGRAARLVRALPPVC